VGTVLLVLGVLGGLLVAPPDADAAMTKVPCVLTFGGRAGADQPSVSADGTALAYVQAGDGVDDPPQVVLDRDGLNGPQAAITDHEDGSLRSPDVDAHGDLVLYVRDEVGPSESLRLVDVAAEQDEVLVGTVPDGTIGTAVLSDDGSTVAFDSTGDHDGSNPEGNREVFTFDVAGSVSDAVTAYVSGSSEAPSISADGSVLAFESTGHDVPPAPYWPRLVVWDGTEVRSVDRSEDAHLSDDGTRVAFESWSSSYTHQGSWGPSVVWLDLDPRPGDQPSSYAGGGYGEGVPHEVHEMSGNGRFLFFDANSRSTPWALSGFVAWSYSAIGRPLEFLPLSSDDSGRVVAGMHDDLLYVFDRCGAFTDVASSHPFFEHIEWLFDDETARGGFDGEFLPASSTSRGAMAAFLYRFAGAPAFTPPSVHDETFPDVPAGHWFWREVEWVAAEEITTGYGDGTYRPSAPVTRQSMSAFIHRAVGEPPLDPPAEATFADVSTSHPFFAEVEWMAAEGISTGYGDETFRPTAPVTRQAMAAFLHRAGPLRPT
jgi:Tol biopolymer transport system component